MRRSALIAAVVATMAVFAVPAHAADVTVTNFAFAPSTVNVAPGETVTWKFAGPDVNHSATSDPGQAESWDSDPGNSSPSHTVGDTFPHTFTQEGTYSYFCKVHPFMRARVVVGAAGQGPPAGDTTAPQLSTLKANARRRRVTFKLDEPATVAVKLRGPTRKDQTLNGKAGTNVLKLPKRMKPGRHTVTLTATDAAGNKSPAARVVVSVSGKKR
jgi:plastocyanin